MNSYEKEMFILIAEDSATQRERLKAVLQSSGYNVLAAENGKRALNIAKNNPPDIILSDIMMPEMNGYELCQRIKAEPGLKTIPVILLTALTEPQDVINGLTCGADFFITKPYSDSYLLSKVENVLKGETIDQEEETPEIEITYGGKTYSIAAGRMQTINLLLSTFENAMQKNQELDRTNRELTKTKWELQELNNKLTRQSALLKTIFDSIPIMLLIYSKDKSSFDVNRYFEHITGWKNEEIKGVDLLSCLYPDPEHKILAEEIVNTPTDQFKDIKLTRKDGTQIETSWANVEIPDGRHAIIGLNITERKEMETRLKKHAEELSVANDELKSFSYSVSHDLRSPLRVIAGFSEILLEDYADNLDQPGKDYLDRIVDSTNKMNNIINDMLSLSRISRQELEFQEIDLTDMAHSIIYELQQSQPERKVSVRIEENLKTKGDLSLLRLAISNLLSNAWKYTGNSENPVIEFGKKRENRKTVYFISDNGAGFSMSDYEHLFAPFQRLHSGSDFPGTGVGLAIVKRAIRRHNGKIWATGEQGKGATFYFTVNL
ncbi:sensor histidine kinase [Chitinispirillum alkaliphilum]|nr:sensor histidine kinase [Chitinispirillum alkaliphilum]